MSELITKDQVIDWFRCYGHMDKPIPYDVLVTDIQAMDPVDAANLQQNDNCAAIAQKWISVTERMPKLIPCRAGTAYSEAVNVLTSDRKVLQQFGTALTGLAHLDSGTLRARKLHIGHLYFCRCRNRRRRMNDESLHSR